LWVKNIIKLWVNASQWFLASAALICFNNNRQTEKIAWDLKDLLVQPLHVVIN
jgi:hypothetical protein